MTLEPAAVQARASEIKGDAVFSLDPSMSLVASPWPIDRIWRTNQPEAAADSTVDLSAGGVALEIRRLGDDVVFRGLDPGVFAFREALARRRRLTEAVARALAADQGFVLAGALAALVEEGLLDGITRPA